ncbi:alpha/beta hydrolase [Cystobacter fuscus]|nr:alpha/beta hydrolase [Cystobacter fuscus]
MHLVTATADTSWARPGQFHSLGPFDVPGFPSRRAHVYVPSGDDVPLRERPVLYLFDGQNCWTDWGSYAGGWYAHEAAEQLVGSPTFRAPVVVGLEHGGDRRIDELSPWEMTPGRGGHAEHFFDWVVHHFMPHVQHTFGLTGGALHTVVGGSSMGGLAALWAHYRYPHAIGGAIAMSPAFSVGDKALFPFVDSRPKPLISRVYIDCGGREGGGRMLAVAEEMHHVLERKGYPEGGLMWRPDQNAGHNEKAWRRRLPKALRFMFRR